MKWFNRTAQGFSPGSRRGVESMLNTLNALRRHFQGESSTTPNPGLKPWAILWDHFVVEDSQSIIATMVCDDERVLSPLLSSGEALRCSSSIYRLAGHQEIRLDPIDIESEITTFRCRQGRVQQAQSVLSALSQKTLSPALKGSGAVSMGI